MPQLAINYLNFSAALKSANMKTAPALPSVTDPQSLSSSPLTSMPSLLPPPPALGLPCRVRLHLPAHNHDTARRRRDTHCAIPRQVAFLPLPGHAGAILRPLLPAQLPCTPERPCKSPRHHPGILSPTPVLCSAFVLWNGQLGVQHDLPYEGFPTHGRIGLPGGRC